MNGPSKIVVGLGNPGERYRDTRHNVGRSVVEELARRRGISLDRTECKAITGGGELLLVLPQTYMNRSGYAVRCLFERDGYEAADLLVVLDELSLPFGKLRLRRQGGPGGHRGLESVIDNLRTDQIARLRMGIAPQARPEGGDEQVDFVLSEFDEEEREAAGALVARAADACECWLDEGIEAAMNRFNG